MRRIAIWHALDGGRAEAARLDLSTDGIVAEGVQIGADPLPYRLDYRLQARGGYVTRSLEVAVEGEAWSRRLALQHDGRGAWRCETAAAGSVGLGTPGGDAGALAGALDCDLGLSPLTNLMPVRRHALHERPGRQDLLMAWVSVPDLAVRASAQRYEHVRPGASARAAIVRYVDRGVHSGFRCDLEVDRDGLVLLYPGLARRVGHATGNAS